MYAYRLGKVGQRFCGHPVERKLGGAFHRRR